MKVHVVQQDPLGQTATIFLSFIVSACKESSQLGLLTPHRRSGWEGLLAPHLNIQIVACNSDLISHALGVLGGGLDYIDCDR